MAESDAAGPAPAGSPAPKTTRPTTLADAHRDIERSLAPLRSAQNSAAVATAPIRAAMEATAKAFAPFREIERKRVAMLEQALAPAREFERQQRQMFAAIDAAIGPYLREIVGAPARRTAPEPRSEDAADRLTTTNPPPVSPAASSVAPAHPRVILDTSPETMSALVERVVEAVVRRLAAAPSTKAGVKSRRGRRRREISVGGVDAALEALAEEDPSVRALAARALEERIPYSRRTIENCATYKAWRRDLKALRVEAEADDMADVLDAGLARIRKKKPGRGRLVDPTIDPAVEKMTKEFLRFHGEKGLDGQ